MRKINFNDFTLIPSERRLLCAGREVVLNPKAYDLLTILAENPGQVISKDEIMERLWPDSSVEEGNLAVQISNLRSALKIFSEEPVIRTVPGIGYCFAMGINENDDGISDERCNHRGSCAGIVINRSLAVSEADNAATLLIDCIESAASERDEIHLYSRKPHRNVRRANGGLFFEIRFKRVETHGKSGIALEFTNPSTEEVRFRIVVSEKDLKNNDVGMETARRVMGNFSDRVVLGWRQSEELRDASSRGFIDNIITQVMFLMEIETAASLDDAELLIDNAIGFSPSESRLHRLKLEIRIAKASIEKNEIAEALSLAEKLNDGATRSGTPNDEAILASARIAGILLGNHAEALDILQGLDRQRITTAKENILRADILHSIKRIDEARALLQNALEINPLCFSAMRRLAKSYLDSGDSASAFRTASSLLRFLPYDKTALDVIALSGEGETSRPIADKQDSSSSGGGAALSNGHASKSRARMDLREKRDQFVAVSMIKEAIGDKNSASAYRRLVKMIDVENPKASDEPTAAGRKASPRRKPPTSGDEFDSKTRPCE